MAADDQTASSSPRPTRRRLSALSRSIEGRVCVITGTASGMGRATAHPFADEGAHVALIDRTRGGVEVVADEITEAGGWVVV